MLMNSDKSEKTIILNINTFNGKNIINRLIYIRSLTEEQGAGI